MSDGWDHIAQWWEDVGVHDPSYRHDVVPLLDDLVVGDHAMALDLGCGTGHLGRLIGGTVIGVDASQRLARSALGTMPVAVGRAPDLSFLADASFDLVVSVYLVDLLGDHRRFLEETHRVVRPGGDLVVVINHPAYTAPGAAPIADPDGEVLWRWGSYFTQAWTDEPAGPGSVRYHHRSLATLLQDAADVGWHLTAIRERPLSPEVMAEMPGYEGQDTIPRYLGARWSRPGS
jgi:SAM-dependent methyltransferase